MISPDDSDRDPRYGMGTFTRRTKITPPIVRGLEAAGVIRPARSDSGWRMFSERDIAAALAWKAGKRARA